MKLQIGNDSVTNTVQAPLWSYKLGLDNGFIPTDPRQAAGLCNKLGVLGAQFSGTYPATATGGGGAGTLVPSATESFGTFPPTSIAGVPAGQVSLIPTYTATRAPLTLPPPSYTSVDSNVQLPNGWFDNQDTAQIVFPVSGCVYPDAWLAASSPVPASACGATASAGAGAGAVLTTAASVTAAPTGASASTSVSLPTAAPTSAPPVRALKGSRHQ
jgi:glucan 1,3-beta-glucosidase